MSVGSGPGNSSPLEEEESKTEPDFFSAAGSWMERHIVTARLLGRAGELAAFVQPGHTGAGASN